MLCWQQAIILHLFYWLGTISNYREWLTSWNIYFSQPVNNTIISFKNIEGLVYVSIGPYSVSIGHCGSVFCVSIGPYFKTEYIKLLAEKTMKTSRNPEFLLSIWKSTLYNVLGSQCATTMLNIEVFISIYWWQFGI